MANKIIIKGFFGIKQVFNVVSTDKWYAGQLFVFYIPPPPPNTERPLSPYDRQSVDDYVERCSTSGSAILGVAMENSAGKSKVDILHDHSRFIGTTGKSKVNILHGHSAFEMTASSQTEAHNVYEKGIEKASLMDLLYASANGKWSNIGAGVMPMPIGFITKIPTAENSYTLGVVLF